MKKTLRPNQLRAQAAIMDAVGSIDHTPKNFGGGRLLRGDSLSLMRGMAADSVDIVFGSPPYENARPYEGVPLYKGEAYVEWMFRFYTEAIRISRGPVVMIMEGRTKDFEYSATPVLLMADLKRAKKCFECGGVYVSDDRCPDCNADASRAKAAFRLRKPPAFMRYGIFGSGGPDYWRNDYEFAVFATRYDVARLPWSDPCAIGQPPKYPPGGDPSHRKSNGERVQAKPYQPPALANPGNMRQHEDEGSNIRRHAVGGGHMGDLAAHKGEAPFPEGLARDFILCFCPPGGTVYDPFIGTGTTAVVAATEGRNFIGSDLRLNQLELTRERLFAKGVSNVIVEA